jgi:hypothetical protein
MKTRCKAQGARYKEKIKERRRAKDKEKKERRETHGTWKPI